VKGSSASSVRSSSSRPRFRLALPLVLATACAAPVAERAKGDVARAVEASLSKGTERFEHPEWDRLLAGGTRRGLVDYRFLQDRRPELEAYLGRLAAARIDRLAPGHLEALLINAYNAYTVQSILDHPRVTSIKQVPGVWTVPRHRVGAFELTLDDIEHRILRPFFKDPRIHFAVNCASRSCAPLPPWAYDGDRIDAQLEERARAFLADPGNVRAEGGKLRLSRYFDWYGEDFTSEGWRDAAPTISAFVAREASREVADFILRHGGKPSIEFLDYDWLLNAAEPPEPGAAPVR
jgi:uncharacterized protein DUF547